MFQQLFEALSYLKPSWKIYREVDLVLISIAKTLQIFPPHWAVSTSVYSVPFISLSSISFIQAVPHFNAFSQYQSIMRKVNFNFITNASHRKWQHCICF